MMIWLYYLIFAIGSLGLVCKSFNVRQFVLLLVIVLPLNGIFFDVGLRVELFKIACLMAIPGIFIQYRRLVSITEIKLFLPFVVWATCVSLVVCVATPDYFTLQSDGARSLGMRTLTQGVFLLIRIALIGLIVVAFRKPGDVLRCLKLWLAVTTVLAGYGVLEQVFHFAGFEIGGVYYGTGLLAGEPTHLTQSLFGLSFKRVGSFAHEPKMLARYLVPSIVILLVQGLSGLQLVKSNLQLFLVLFLHLLALVFTFSTSGLIILAASLFVPLFSVIGIGGFVRRYTVVAALAGIVLIVGPQVMEQLVSKVISDKVEKYGGFIQAGSDGPGVNFIYERPVSAILGSGVGTQGHYLPNYIPVEYGYIFDNYKHMGFGGMGVESDWLSMILDTGVIGLVFFLLPITRCWRMSQRILAGRIPEWHGLQQCSGLIYTRTFMGCVLCGMIAYPMEQAGMVAVAFGLLVAATRISHSQTQGLDRKCELRPVLSQRIAAERSKELLLTRFYKCLH